MRRFLGVALAIGIAAVLAFGALAVVVGRAPFPAITAGPAPEGATSVRGFFHVHAEGSKDASGTVDEAAAAAAELGGRFLVLTEHNQLRPEFPAMRHGVLIVPETELSTPHGHVVALGLDRQVGRGIDVLDQIAAGGGDAVIAHPTNRKRPWTGPAGEKLAGWEGWSLYSSLRNRLAAPGPVLLLSAAALLGDDRKAGALLLDDPASDLARFDTLTAERPLSLLCGVDAHGLPPYRVSFGALAIHVDVGRRIGTFGDAPIVDAAAVREAIVSGRLFCSVPALGDAASFSFRRVGDEVVASIDAPFAELRLLRDGVEVARDSRRASTAATPGVYRAEVQVTAGFPWTDRATWIVASPMRVEAPPGCDFLEAPAERPVSLPGGGPSR